MTSESLPLDAQALGGSTAEMPGSPWARLAVAFAASLVAGGVLLLALLLGIQFAYAGRALPGVNIGGVDLGGLTRSAASDRLRTALPSLGHGTVMLVIGGETIPLDYAELGREYDTDAMLDAAFAVGRSGDPLARGLEELRALVRGSSVAPQVRWQHGALAAALKTAAASFDREVVDATVTRDAKGAFVVSPAT